MAITTTLSAYENEILDKVLDGEALAFIAWIDEDGSVEFGRVRWAHRNPMPGQRDRWSASPFPGAWVDVPRDQIIRVRHADTV